ncbi:NRDE family protein [Shewanella surugensis]|uniref:NRDE family protein n=1 Tax=Shewanella surugensis TaxID=212020 RepID=A0ABT0L8L5_9GAMM|nr:NRDE family protein [Shewanella surugensis]MCL1124039.1 NRDE family protein [Shewanella surugensis]
MCILFIAFKSHPQFPLIVCANRDELHYRPTQEAHFWQPEQTILAGKDLEAGGTWLGINKQGEIAALTNIRAPELMKQEMKTRGELPLLALAQPNKLSTLWLNNHSHLYNPFNILYGNHQALYCYDSRAKSSTTLTSGYHAVSNGALDDIWPKMAKGNDALQQHINTHITPDPDVILSLLKDNQQAEDENLPHTGIGLEWERQLSSIYIKHPEYGTRSSSIILINHHQQAHFIEVQYDGKGRTLGRQDFHFKIEND